MQVLYKFTNILWGLEHLLLTNRIEALITTVM